MFQQFLRSQRASTLGFARARPSERAASARPTWRPLRRERAGASDWNKRARQRRQSRKSDLSRWFLAPGGPGTRGPRGNKRPVYVRHPHEIILSFRGGRSICHGKAATGVGWGVSARHALPAQRGGRSRLRERVRVCANASARRDAAEKKRADNVVRWHTSGRDESQPRCTLRGPSAPEALGSLRACMVRVCGLPHVNLAWVFHRLDVRIQFVLPTTTQSGPFCLPFLSG